MIGGNLGKFQAKADIGNFILGMLPSRKGYRIYNKRLVEIMETIHVTSDEMHQSDGACNMRYLSSTEINAACMFHPGTSLSTTIAQDAPSTSASSSTSDIHHPIQHQEIAEEPTHEDTPDNPTNYITHQIISEDDQRTSSGKHRWQSISTSNLQKTVSIRMLYGARSLVSQLKDLKTMKIPPRLSPKKALYGLKQAPKGVLIAEQDHCGMSRSRRSTSEVLQFLEIDWLAWIIKKAKKTAISTQRAKYIAMSWMLCSESFGCDHSSKTTDFAFNKIPLYSDNKSLLLYA
ncbi:hypothetical protein Tco_0706154 [Tanacetum coccineum]|uniref:Uncharacterized protein n=1 Tax=Tanacetum coccineum TaxID=301880 RepID=A0ABQ4Y861_9ASTR